MPLFSHIVSIAPLDERQLDPNLLLKYTSGVDQIPLPLDSSILPSVISIWQKLRFRTKPRPHWIDHYSDVEDVLGFLLEEIGPDPITGRSPPKALTYAFYLINREFIVMAMKHPVGEIS